MNDRLTVVINDDADLELLTVSCWAHEHRGGRIVGGEHDHVVALGVEHVVVADAVLARAGLDVHATA